MKQSCVGYKIAGKKGVGWREGKRDELGPLADHCKAQGAGSSW